MIYFLHELWLIKIIRWLGYQLLINIINNSFNAVVIVSIITNYWLFASVSVFIDIESQFDPLLLPRIIISKCDKELIMVLIISSD